MKWTTFVDMHSGGGRKADHEAYVMQGSEADCRGDFQAITGRDPDHVSCECCGPDYSVSEHDSREEAVMWRKEVHELARRCRQCGQPATLVHDVVALCDVHCRALWEALQAVVAHSSDGAS